MAREPDWRRVIDLAREHFGSVQKADEQVLQQQMAAQEAGIPLAGTLFEVKIYPRPSESEIYRAVMEALYGVEFWPWFDERTVDVLDGYEF
jgi:hypothetical protein